MEKGQTSPTRDAICGHRQNGTSTKDSVKQIAKVEVKEVLAVLYAKGYTLRPGQIGKGFLKKGSQAEPLTLTYLTHVDQTFIHKDGEGCWPKRLGVPESIPGQLGEGQLSPYEFWDLVREYPLVGEQDPPPHRESLRRVPDFASMVARHGPWLAHRMWRLLEPSLPPAPSSTIFVAPQGEATSNALAQHINTVLGARTVLVPRNLIEAVIDALSSPQKVVEAAWRAGESWSRELEGAANGSRVCILDDFLSSGKTSAALRQLVGYSGSAGRAEPLTIAGVCCIADFSQGDGTSDVYALYGWERAF